jgi:hypothetical protein
MQRRGGRIASGARNDVQKRRQRRRRRGQREQLLKNLMTMEAKRLREDNAVVTVATVVTAPVTATAATVTATRVVVMAMGVGGMEEGR